MISRRDFASRASLAVAGTGLAALAATTSQAAPVTSSALAPTPALPFAGEWTASGSLRRAGGTLNFAVVGEAKAGVPPVILLHKLGGWLSDWRFVAPLLAQGRQVIAFDLPGHGGSRWDGAAPYIQTLGETAALLVGAFDEMGFDKVDLIGTSLGGCLSVPLAAFWPERVRSLALVSCALGGRKTLDEIRTGIDEKQTDLFDANGNPVPTPPELIEKIFGIVHPAKINAEGILSRRAAGKWIQPSERGVGMTDIAGTLPRIAAPTLLVYGEFDKAYVKFRKGAEAALRNGRTQVVKNAGAFVMQDNPSETARILNAFLASL
ncbi:alpha/beta fold hydrolase [Novosphingobium profundi]|uniref:alpha/beta fold hydrolase n=1 Tax=Novosphingobium profundi TaxID=1774954 RepID=UPI001BDA417E|nr:alpha/beta fold hydrolase [Novosphingobium profundi]MBT0669543.1 alpha/beta fold hydrolase [Novosphingobium profundi]